MNISEVLDLSPQPAGYKPVADPVEISIAKCADPATPLDAISEIDNKIRYIKETVKRYEEARDAAIVERIKACGGQGFTLGTVRYYIGVDKVTKVRDLKECLMQLLGLLGPDETAMCLSSNAIKHGQTRKSLEATGNAEVYDTLFETTEKETLKEGKPTKEKVLQRVDTRFLKQPKGE